MSTSSNPLPPDRPNVWILGATGRTGRAVAADLVASDVVPTLVGRSAERLNDVAADLGGAAEIVVASSVEEMAAMIARERPTVVLNTVGPYSATGEPVARACLAGSHYADLANDLASSLALTALDRTARDAGRTFVTGAGFGVVGTEAVVARLCEGRPSPASVRVDSVASVATTDGVVGAALAATILDALTMGGRVYRDGRLVGRRTGADRQHLTTPEDDEVTTAGGASGELYAAWRASGAPSVVATSALAPTSTVTAGVLPLVRAAVRLPWLRGVAERRLAQVSTSARPRPRQHSWGHAVVTWADGSRREGWLRAGDGMDFTAAVLAETARRLLRGEGERGAATPAVTFGADVAEAAGGEILVS